MRNLLLTLSLLALSARAADTPLSAVLIEGEGWQPLTEGLPTTAKPPDYVSRKDDSGGWAVWHDGKKVAEAKKDEFFGIAAVSPGGGKLVVAVPSHHYLYAFQIDKDGSLYARDKTYAVRKEKLGKGGSGLNAMVFDTKGRLWASVPEGVVYFDEDMRFSGMLSRPLQAPVRLVALVGDELIIECGGKPWKRKVKAMGARTAG